MKKLTFFLIFCLLLCSCNNDKQITTTTTVTTPPETTTTTTSQATTASITTTAPITTDVTTTEKKELLGYFIDYVGEKVCYKDAVKLSVGMDEVTPEEAERSDIVYCEYEGFTYGIFSNGVFLNSFENEFDYDNYCFKDIPVFMEGYALEKLRVGDTYGPLTVSEASCTLMVANDENIAQYMPDGICLQIADITFSGEVTLTGYVRTAEADEGYAEEGDIFLYVDTRDMPDIPYLVFPEVKKIYTPQTYYCGDHFQTYSDMPFIRLGSVYKDYSGMDLSMIPLQNSGVAHVKVTISDISMRTGETVLGYIKGKIVSIEEIQ